MATDKDFKTATSGDLEISGGDLEIFESDTQHIADIVISAAGEWKEYPTLGVGLEKYINASVSQQTLRNEVTAQLTTDSFRNIDVQFENNNDMNFTVDAVRG